MNDASGNVTAKRTILSDRWAGHDAFSPKEISKILGISADGAYAALRTGQIRSVRIGRRLVVPRAALEQLLEP